MEEYNLEEELINAFKTGSLFCVEKLIDEGVEINNIGINGVRECISGFLDSRISGNHFRVLKLLFETERFNNFSLNHVIEEYTNLIDDNGTQLEDKDNLMKILIYLCEERGFG